MEWNTLVLGLLVLSVAASSNNTSTASTPSPSSSTRTSTTVKSTAVATTSTTTATSTSSTTSTKPGSTTHDPNVMRPHAHNDFYNAHCTSHMYELSLSSFAAWWTMLNALILMGAFCIVLRHCCFQNFTATTTKGY
ncbi:envelope glycoprotein N [Human betaherpesvirus 5]|uniref:Envelope glycoprotein N n=6 Tax=Human cytomegalovirus TaxID=10359 RepID=Q8JJJ9_HCMV|nr:structural glycoprotein gpUL73 [Human betaherpesvirus 5]ATP76469.1 envelope glycoprotein N [synthetic human betaherpesvirus 5]AAM82387.1 structural glycoprotein gpUL73 [Human betaherpesvirus 5]AAO24844.1 envelope glycoprotein gpUL73 [Human betaherpesvirus 5]AAO24853.1 envelope glycoprotein gpUL73 [Human betaherpesvirus 5]